MRCRLMRSNALEKQNERLNRTLNKPFLLGGSDVIIRHLNIGFTGLSLRF